MGWDATSVSLSLTAQEKDIQPGEGEKMAAGSAAIRVAALIEHCSGSLLLINHLDVVVENTDTCRIQVARLAGWGQMLKEVTSVGSRRKISCPVSSDPPGCLVDSLIMH